MDADEELEVEGHNSSDRDLSSSTGGEPLILGAYTDLETKNISPSIDGSEEMDVILDNPPKTPFCKNRDKKKASTHYVN